MSRKVNRECKPLESGFRHFDVELGDVECDVDLKNFPFMNTGSSRIAFKTAVFGTSMSADLDGDDSGDSDEITAGGVNIAFAPMAAYSCATVRRCRFRV